MTTRFSSNFKLGNGVDSEPVAIRIFDVLRRTFLAPSEITSTSDGDLIVAFPVTQVTLFFFSKNSIPLVSSLTMLSFLSIIFFKFKLTLLISIP